MSTTRFRIIEHTLPASHIREFQRATADSQEDELHVAIKQYVPLESASTTGSGITVIGAHANGFPKEMYEPLWDELYDRLKVNNINIRSVWIADVAHQGQSGVLNETKLGNDPSWMDHSRDLLLMVSHFRKEMKRPLVGIGHSMGGAQLVNLSLMHPRLFTTLILVDPVIQRYTTVIGVPSPAKASVQRRDRWPSRQDAATAFKRSKFYQTWDPRVFDKWIEYGLRELPTFLYPETNASSMLPTVSADHSTATIQPAKNTERSVTLTTTTHQEVITFLRGNFKTADFPSPSSDPNPLTHPDVDTSHEINSPFYRAEPNALFARLPFLRPSVFYLFAELSFLSTPVLEADKLAHTGTGPGGSGGVVKGRVKSITLKGIGHLIPMEAVNQTADECAAWLGPEIERWRKDEEVERIAWAAVPKQQRSQLSDEYVTIMRSDWQGELERERGLKKSKL